MQRFVAPIRESLQQQIWMPALMSALVLPDICGWLETPADHSGARYKRWAQKWFEPKYTTVRRGEKVVFLSASDLYALRCSVTHSGSDDITEHKAQDVLTSFAFFKPRQNFFFHCNRSGTRLQLQVDQFACDLCDAVEEWASAVSGDPVIETRMQKLVELRSAEWSISV